MLTFVKFQDAKIHLEKYYRYLDKIIIQKGIEECYKQIQN